MSRLPTRWKLTLAFALALAIVLTSAGVFLHFSSALTWTMTSNATSALVPLSSVDC
jgi:hypothetical protein